ncbi:MAG: bifunctional DNA primase/polymerase [Acidobacteriaceae bacterium]|nr:bifunctional DNA primase/polymerase [Acidobacteriaceae bacterium]
MNNQLPNIIDFAIRQGWKVFPLDPKIMFAPDQPFLQMATSSIEQIEQWLQLYPDWQWAVVTGPQTSVFAVELHGNIGVNTMLHRSEGDLTGIDTFQIHTKGLITLFFRWPASGLPTNLPRCIPDGVYMCHARGYAKLGCVSEEQRSLDSPYDTNAPVLEVPPWLLNAITQPNMSCRSAVVSSIPHLRPGRLPVRMFFAQRNGRWICSFFTVAKREVHVKTLKFRSWRLLFRTARRGGYPRNPVSRSWLRSGLRKGKGHILLLLTPAQYQKLRAAKQYAKPIRTVPAVP